MTGGEPELLLVDGLVFVAVDISGSGNRRPIDFRVAVFDVPREAARCLRDNLECAGDNIDCLPIAGKLLQIEAMHEVPDCVNVLNNVPESLAGVLRRHRRHHEGCSREVGV